jgi:hypothetical protein
MMKSLLFSLSTLSLKYYQNFWIVKSKIMKTLDRRIGNSPYDLKRKAGKASNTLKSTVVRYRDFCQEK